MSALCSLKFSGSFPGLQWFSHQEAMATKLSLKLGGSLSSLVQVIELGKDESGWHRARQLEREPPVDSSGPLSRLALTVVYISPEATWAVILSAVRALSTPTQEGQGRFIPGLSETPVGRQLCSPP